MDSKQIRQWRKKIESLESESTKIKIKGLTTMFMELILLLDEFDERLKKIEKYSS